MTFINKKPVYAEFFKGYNIVLSALIVQLLQLYGQRFFCFFKLFYGELIAPVCFQVNNSIGNIPYLLLQNHSLTLKAHRDFLELTMPNNHSVIVPSCNSAAEAFAVFHLKVFLRCDQNICRRVELQELRRPLLRQVIRNNEQGFTAQSEPFGFHSSGGHFKGFACAYGVCQERIAAVKDMGNGVLLVFPKLNFRIHTTKNNMASVILTGTDTIEFIIVKPN